MCYFRQAPFLGINYIRRNMPSTVQNAENDDAIFFLAVEDKVIAERQTTDTRLQIKLFRHHVRAICQRGEFFI